MADHIPKVLKIQGAKPYDFSFPLKHTALLVIDMQRDFLLPGGFGDIQGGNLDAVQASIKPTKTLLSLCRGLGLKIFHTREGHKPDLSDCPTSKLYRQKNAPGNEQHSMVIGDNGQMGRLLVRSEYGHDIVNELKPLPGEIVIDKPGKGSFWGTTLMHKLKIYGITHLLVSGVTTECCFSTSIREANDRGFECCGIEEATAGYNDQFKTSSLDMIFWSQGLFGFVASLSAVVDAVQPHVNPLPMLSVSTPPLSPAAWNGDLRISSLMTSYRGGLSPVTVMESIWKSIEAYETVNPGVWIRLESKDTVLEVAKGLARKYPNKAELPPLFGVPFSVKDSIDLASLPTTTACPPLAYHATSTSPVVESLIEQGAIFIGKANLDQLATGLTGQRSPYGAPSSVFNKKYISGGSSSGSCVSVGASLCSFSIATDTAGSGRVPSGFNGCVGFKGTRGYLSTVGLVPACLSLDCLAIIAKTVEDARLVFALAESWDPQDRYSKWPIGFERHVNSLGPTRFKFGIPPPDALAVCSPVYKRMFAEAVDKLQNIGGVLKPINWEPFEKAGRLLYDGTFVSERLASLPDDWLETNKDHLHPVIRELFEAVASRGSTAVQAYRDLQDKALYTRQAELVFEYSEAGCDVVVVPTAPTHWTVEEVKAEPIKRNSFLGEFTHFGNVLDLCAVAVPASKYAVSELSGKPDDPGELPFSITFLGGSRSDPETLEIARRFEEAMSEES